MWQGWLLCLIAGWVDAVGFLRFDAFPANMTGNSVLASIALTHYDWGTVLEHLLAVLSFLGGAAMSRVLERLLGAVRPALAVSILILLATPWMAGEGPLFAMAVAMGLQAGAIGRFGGLTFPTVVITSTLQRTGQAIVERLWPGGKQDEAALILPLGLAVISYMLGAAAGTFATEQAPWPLVPPAMLTVLVLLKRP